MNYAISLTFRLRNFSRYNDEDPKWTDQTFKRLQNLNEEERKIIDYILTTFENNKK